ncbi:MAG TPA: class I SAM-dependent methyltransferase [Gemmatimonadaceae bacterium]|jgi:2-polyprenyl-3-methyl-5-hydroxy-6-metoxy-1,4-benzoquinol methylase
MSDLSDKKIIDSWHTNAAPWTDAVRNDEIESRRLVTNAAVVETILARHPKSVIDIGCGEGWLARALAANGIGVTGVDVVPELIEKARVAGGANYHVASYEEIAQGAIDATFDVAVATFSLIGEQSVDDLIRAAPRLLTPTGALIIQTLHPVVATGEHPYVDGWRAGSWTGFSDAFSDPAPWYFRTLGSWIQLVASSGLRLVDLREPVHPKTGKPASLILIAEQASS